MKGKYIVPLILASVTATTFGATAQFSVKADYDATTALSGDLIKISGFKGEGEVGTEITLPTAVVSTATATVKVTVLDPRGKEVTVTNNKFTPTLKGYYTVKYAAQVENQMDTVTDELKIFVKGNDYAISLPTNSEYIVPATVKTNTEILIPLPTVTENGKDMTVAQVKTGLSVTISNKDNASSKVELTASTQGGYDSTKNAFIYKPTQAGVYEIVYRYKDTNNTVRDYKTDSFVVKDSFNSDDIDLSFSYKSSKPTTAVLGNKTTLPQIKVFDKNNSSSELDAYVTITVKNVETGNVYTVEDYSFVPMDKGAYEVTYKASIPLFNKETKTNTFRIENVKDNVSPDVMVVNSYEVDTENPSKITRVYRDVNKDGAYTAGTDVELFNAADTANADLTEEELEEKINQAMGDATYNIPSVVYLTSDGSGTAKATVKIPAIYATDNFSKLENITFTRSVKTKSGLITTIKKTNDNGTKEDYPAGSWAEYTFTAEGDYTIRYEAKDENGNSYMDSFPVKVLSSDAKLKDDGVYKLPTINFPAFTSYAKKSATITLTKPTATDDFDTYVETRVYYSLDDANYVESNEITKVDKDGKLVLDLSTISGIESASKIRVHAVAYNDYNTTPATIVREVQLINTADANAPTFDGENSFMTNLAKINFDDQTTIDAYGMISGKPAFNQKDIVKLPAYVISDAEDTNLNISVKVKDPNGKTVTVKNSAYTKEVGTTKTTYTIQNGTFVADYSGVYTITYTAKDAGGNIVTKSYGVRVRDTEKPNIVLSSYAPFTESVEVGKFVEIPAATLTDKGVTLTDITTDRPFDSRKENTAGTYWELVEGPSHNTMGTIGFTPEVAGDYVIKYYGWDAEGNYTESKQYTITATDTIKPTIKLETNYVLEPVEWVEDGVVEVYAPAVIELYDGYRDSENSENNYDQTPVEDITLKVEVKDKNNNIVENTATDHKVVPDPQNPEATINEYFELSDGVYATRYKFVAETQGVYTITYTATDGKGNSSQTSVTVSVGDTDAPVVEFVDAEEDLISTAKIGDSLEFNLDMIKVDEILGASAIQVPTGQDSADYKLTVNMYDSSSSLVSNVYKNDSTKKNSYKWEFEKSGTYELRITAEDAAGNKTQKSYKIVVEAEETKDETVSPVVGTVLIIVSAVILVGVVTYFIVTSRTQTTTKKGPKSKKQ